MCISRPIIKGKEKEKRKSLTHEGNWFICYPKH